MEKQKSQVGILEQNSEQKYFNFSFFFVGLHEFLPLTYEQKHVVRVSLSIFVCAYIHMLKLRW